MNKILNKVIVTLLILIFTIPSVNILETKGITKVLDASLDKSLKEGSTNPIPIESALLGAKNQVFLSWDMNQINGVPFEFGKFTLEYPIEKDRKIIFTVERKGPVADITYEMKQFDTNTSTWQESPQLNYDIHTNIGAGGSAKYIKSKDFIATGFNDANINYQVINNLLDISDPTSAISPKFRIELGKGFSFKYNEKTIHFKWNESDGKFYYLTNGIVQGLIYDFKLSYATSNITGSDIQKVITGINSETFRSIPLANNGNTVNSKLDIDTNLKVSQDILDLTSTAGDKNPGTDEVEMVLRFDMPKAWDPITRSFTADPTDPMPISILLGNKDPLREIKLKISDITKLIFSDSDLIISANDTGSASASNNGLERVNIDGRDRISIRLGNLKPGEIYNEASISIISNDSYLASKTIFDFGKVFTFLNYEVVSEGGKFYILANPYNGYEGYYMLTSGENLEPSVIQYSNGKTPVLLPLTVNALNGQDELYQLFFKPGQPFVGNDRDKAIYSQKIRFKATSSMTGIGIPTEFDVVNDYKLIPIKDNITGDLATLFMNIKWNIGDTKVINKMVENAYPKPLTITYNILNSLTPSEEKSKSFSTVTLEIFKENNTLFVKYSDEKGKLLNTEKEIFEIKSQNQEGTTYYVANVKLGVDAAQKDADIPNPQDMDFLYQNIYFLNVKPKLVNGLPVSIGASLYDSITLNDITKLEVVPPQNLEALEPITKNIELGSDLDEVSFKLKWDMPSSKIKEYIDNTYPYPKDKIDIKVNLYISQNETYLREKFSTLSFLDRALNSVKTPYLKEYNDTLYFSPINGNLAMNAEGYKDPREALRNTKVVKVEGITITDKQKNALITSGEALSVEYKLDGLDKNQKYYIYSDLVVTHKDTNDVIKIEKSSKVSNLVYMLTTGDKEEIDSKEKIPTAPVINKENVGLSEATLFWNKIYSFDAQGTPEKIEYEIIRLNNAQMNDKLLETREPFETFFINKMPAVDKAGFRTDNLIMEKFNGTSFLPVDKNIHVYDPINEIIKFTDKSLSPNQLYFYYVRSVRTVNDLKIYSVWSNISLTTTPVKNPINLKILREGISYNKKNEFLIEFDAPIEDLNNLGTEFTLQYSLKEDGKDFENPVNMDSTELKRTATKSAVEGHTHFQYKISNLKPGTSYTIRVRMVDKNNDTSLYSNSAVTRTEIDQAEYDKDEKIEDILDHMKKQLDELLKEYYFTTINNSNTLEIVYRPTMFDTFISQSTDGILSLPSSNANQLVYYFPASALASLNEANKGFKIEHGDLEIILSKNSIKSETSEAIKAITEKIKNKSIADYYLKVSLNFKDMVTSVQNNKALSQQVDVKFEIVGSREDNEKWDETIFEFISGKIKTQLSDERTKKTIKNKIEAGDTNEEIVTYLNNLVSSLKTDYAYSIKDKLSRIIRYSYLVEKLDNNLIIVLKNIDQTTKVSGFQKLLSDWISVETTDFLNGKAIYTLVHGIYIFTGYEINIVGIENTENAENIKNLVAKYNLGDFFGNNGFTVNNNITKSMLVNTMARMLGSAKGADPINYLSAKGIAVNNRNMQSQISTQEAISLIMSLYEQKTSRKISTIKIRDYNTIASIKNIDDKNKLSIQVAFETGLYTNKKMNPNEKITIKDVLNMLVAINNLK